MECHELRSKEVELNKIVVPENLALALLRYLHAKPYGEVQALVEELSKAKTLEQELKPEKPKDA